MDGCRITVGAVVIGGCTNVGAGVDGAGWSCW
jgi:hypothetical protein